MEIESLILSNLNGILFVPPATMLSKMKEEDPVDPLSETIDGTDHDEASKTKKDLVNLLHPYAATRKCKLSDGL